MIWDRLILDFDIFFDLDLKIFCFNLDLETRTFFFLIWIYYIDN